MASKKEGAVKKSDSGTDEGMADTRIVCKISSAIFFAFVSIAFEMMSTVQSLSLFLLLIVPFLSKYEVCPKAKWASEEN